MADPTLKEETGGHSLLHSPLDDPSDVRFFAPREYD